MIKNKFEQIANEIQRMIHEGRYTDKLPSEVELAAMFRTTPNTAGKALNILRSRGAITRHTGAGSFVRHQEKQRVTISNSALFSREIVQILEAEFHDLEFIFGDYGTDADLFVWTTTLPFEYGEKILPLPEVLLQELRNCPDFYPEAFEVHTRNGVCFGVPYLISPIVLAYNKKIMRKLRPDFQPYEQSYEEFLELVKAANELPGIQGLDTSRFEVSALCPVLYRYSMEAKEMSAGVVRQSFREFERIACYAGEKGYSFENNNCLFAIAGRQTLKAFSNSDVVFDIAPYPVPGGGFASVIASETVFVNNQAKNPDILFKVCRKLLSPEAQQIIAEKKHGIPVDCRIALRSMNSGKYRDDIFFNEIRNCLYHHHYLDHRSQLELFLDTHKLCRAEMESGEVQAHLLNNLKIHRDYVEKYHRIQDRLKAGTLHQYLY